MHSLRSWSFAFAAASLVTLPACNRTPNVADSPAPETAPMETPMETPEASPTSQADTDVDYMTNLGLMKGHLLVAEELLDQGKPDQAEPHVGHPVEEIYSNVEEQLQARNVAEFKTTLNGLHDLVQSNPKDPKVAIEMQASMTAVDEAIQAVPADQRQSPGFVLEVINGLLDTAGSEYTAAISNGKIVEVIEYQDSRGFVTYADTLYEGIESQISQKYPEAHEAIESNMTQLMKAWPSATAPATPTMPPEKVSQLVGTIRTNTQKVK